MKISENVRNKLDPFLYSILRIVVDEDMLLEQKIEKFKFYLSIGMLRSNSDDPIYLSDYYKPSFVSCMLEGFDLGEYAENSNHIAGGIYTANLRIDMLMLLMENDEVEYVEAGRLVKPMLDQSVKKIDAKNLADQHNTPLTGKGVVVGVVDYAIDWEAEDFKDGSGETRIAYLWDQDLDKKQNVEVIPNFGYGIEYSKSVIDQVLGNHVKKLEIRHFVYDDHGTHVTGIAAGNGTSTDQYHNTSGQYKGVAPNVTIVFVDLGVPRETNYFPESPNVLDGIQYCFEKATELEMPCVVNLSLGVNTGSHDGKTLMERGIDNLLYKTKGRSVVVSAGNEQDERTHTSGQVSGKGDIVSRSWVIHPGCVLNELTIWYSPLNIFDVRLISPVGDMIEINENAGIDVDRKFPYADIDVQYRRYSQRNGETSIYIKIEHCLSSSLHYGVWQLELVGKEVADGRFNAWIEGTGDNVFIQKGQSRFTLNSADTKQTLCTPATSDSVIVVAASDKINNVVTGFSSLGPTRDGRAKPDLVAPGEGIISSYPFSIEQKDEDGIKYNSVRGAMDGTSMAAPHITGAIALLLQEKSDLTYDQIKNILITSTNNSSHSIDQGYGMPSIAKALGNIKEYFS